MVYIPAWRYLIDVNEDEKETGLGYDSNEDANDLSNIDDEMQVARIFKNFVEFETKIKKKYQKRYQDSLHT